MMIVELLLAQKWKSSSSERYKDLPHQYTMRKNWENPEDFDWCVSHIKAVGYEVDFIGRRWVYYDIGEHQYWAMGTPEWIINRAVRR